MRTIALFFFVLFSLSSSAQWNWAKNISIHHWDYGKFLHKTSANIFIAGETGYYGVTPSDVFIGKYDLNGNLMLLITDTACNLYDFATDNSENCYALLRIKNKTVLRKYDSIGNVAWTKSGNLSSITVYRNNLYASCGLDTILRYDLNGNHISSIIAPNISIHKIRTDFNGSLVLTGNKVFDGYIAKYDSIGNFLWEYYDGGTGHNPAAIDDIDFDTANNVYFTGHYSSQMRTMCDTLYPQNNVYGYYTVKINPTGQCQWIDPRGSRNISVTHDGVYLCAYDSMYKYTSSGQLISSIHYPLSPYSTSKKTTDAIYFTGIFTGTIILGNNTLTSSIATDAYLGKYSTSIATAMTEFNHQSCTAFPNPSCGIFQISLNNIAVEQDVCVYDILGNCIMSRTFLKGGKIDLSDQPKGVYFAEISSNEKKYVTKLILQ
ncbi:MAG: hypothetical protein K0S53_3060 [Bacteroidetes bacterium]|jgi:hypothetical protein|nr:hypothetical protein [Bacteroidota bacterium]MDF2452927.1 hypothetical protein [Bacteroidota bacterium]